jgi:hypothetical protein
VIKNPIIKVLLSCWLVILFIFSITPRIFLHDLIADHKDSYFVSSSTDTQVAKKGIHCDCNSLVVDAPFFSESNYTHVNPLLFFIDHQYKINNCFYSVDAHVFSLRGPPAV